VERTVGNSSNIVVTMIQDENVLDEIVVTALGISRDKKSLGYSTQKVGGEEVARVKDANFVNSLSGKISGVQIKSSGTMGGSTNVVIRGNSSLTGSNQALFVVDGVLIDNSNSNSKDQTTGKGGYDYGNAASDINPDDIESINILKGAAASVLYGSKAGNGVILITTKKGKNRDNIGINISSSLLIGQIDKSTYTEYQTQYGAGYGPYYGSTGFFEDVDVDGDGSLDLMVPSTEDASFGAAFDPNLMVFQWNSFYPELTSTYKKATPWVAAKNNPLTFFETSFTKVNSISFGGATDKSTYRLGYTNFDQSGILPNSSIKKNIINFGATHDLTDKFKLNAKITYTNTRAVGRFGTGYDAANPNQSFKQWYQTNVDLKEQEAAYFLTKKNATWNTKSNTNITPAYFNNPYWLRYENYESDSTNRVFGHTTLTYQINDWLSAMGRVTLDHYNKLEEERTAQGNVDPSLYIKNLRGVTDINYDFFLNFNEDLTEDLSLTGLVGTTIERHSRETTEAKTNGGLVVPGLWALSNTKELAAAPVEWNPSWGRNSLFANASLGYKNTYFGEVSYRIEKASTLPVENNVFDYYAVSGSVIFSNLFESELISFGKFRAGYAKVGNAALPLSIYDTYKSTGNLNGNPLYSTNGTKNNPNLKDEVSTEAEVGVEMKFAKNRLGFDVSAYSKKSIDQIMSVSVSTATGYNSQWVNAGEMTNKGVELSLFGSPIKTEDFTWNVNVNWAKNVNEVIKLYDDIEELQLASVQGGVSINATVGHPYGTIKGFDFVYKDGQKVVGANGQYLKTDKKVIIGDRNPEWTGGVINSFKYKNFNFSFLVDVKKGGDVFSLDTWYGYATGVYANTAFTNDLGNPVRNTLADGGGVILDGVNEAGAVNTVRVATNTYANPWGYKNAVNKAHTYDASYVKLREVSLGYSFPKELVKKLKLSALSLTATGKNLWIIHKNTPYADPEAGLSSGNIQGYQSGAYPAIKEFGLNLNLQF